MNWRRWFTRDREIEDEIASHLRMAEADRIERGESAEDARRGVAREFGNLTLVKEATRAVWGWPALEQAAQDLRAGLRIFVTAPSLAAAAVALIALGIGANSAIFSMVNAALIRPAPGVGADHLVSFGVAIRGREEDPGNSYPNYLDYAAQTRTLSQLVAQAYERFTLALEKESYGVRGGLVTPNFFDTLGVALGKGRTFTGVEARLDASGLVAVISDRLWRERFEAREDILGRTILLNGHLAAIIGVAPPHFHGSQIFVNQDVWVPLESYCRIRGTEKALDARGVNFVELFGKLAPGAGLREARAEFATISKRLEMAYPAANRNKAALLEEYSGAGAGVAPAKLFMRVMLLVAMLALVLICANVANLMLARALYRQRELAIRKSIGGSGGRIFRMLLAEGLAISLAALGCAWLFTIWASQALRRALPVPQSMPALDLDFAPDWRVGAYAAALALVSALAFTMAPAIRAWKQDPLPWLKSGEQSVARGRSRLSAALVVVQIALCVALVASAPTDQQSARLLARLRERLAAIPGVVSVSYAVDAPLSFSGMSLGPVRGDPSREPVSTFGNIAGPGYLGTLGVTPRAGRDLSEQDTAAAKKVTVINQNLAEALWPGIPALGRTVTVGRDVVEVVGIAPNGVFSGLQRRKRQNYMLLAYAQRPRAPGPMTFHVRYAGSLDPVARAIRAAVRETDSRMPVLYLRTMNTQLEDAAGPGALVAALLSLFGASSLVVAAIGLYAVVAFNMARRVREFGVRIALGAPARSIFEMILREGLVMTAMGLALGFGLTLAAGRVLGSLLFGITPADAPTYLGAFAALAVVSLAACAAPARRATRIDPIEALRQE